MFTGLIQDIGHIRGICRQSESVFLQLETALAPELALGDSLAVNGVCLTITTTGEQIVTATAIPETLSRTNLGQLNQGSRVNLEPALRLSDRLGGHIVQGHIDGVGTIRSVEKRGISKVVMVEAGSDILQYVVEKGSITIDGVSLTVSAVNTDTLSVALIPHTMGATTLDDCRPGRQVNLEVDLLAKYVKKIVQQTTAGKPPLDEDFLHKHGFLRR